MSPWIVNGACRDTRMLTIARRQIWWSLVNGKRARLKTMGFAAEGEAIQVPASGAAAGDLNTIALPSQLFMNILLGKLLILKLQRQVQPLLETHFLVLLDA